MFIKNLSTGKKEVLFDATNAKPSLPQSRPREQQAERESQRLWSKVTAAIKKGDQRVATDEKTLIEDRQREEAAERGDGVEWKPKLFRRAMGAAGRGGPGDESGEESLDWVIDASVDGKTPEELTKQILAIAPILPSGNAEAAQQSPQSLNLQKSSAPQTPVANHRPQDSHQANNQSAPTSHPIDFGTDGVARDANPGPGPNTTRITSGLKGLSMGSQPPQVTRTDSVDGGEDQFVDAEM